DSVEKIGKQIHEIQVKGCINDIPNMVKEMNIQEIIIAIPSLSPQKCKLILEICSGLKCKVKILPSTLALIDNVSLLQNVRDVNIDDLLGREAVSFQSQNVEQFIDGKVILVTGGGGSIGSELCRQIAASNPKKLIILDIYENNAYEIQQELYRQYGNKIDLAVEIASVRDKEKLEELFDFYRPDILFHAAAHKHVPLMEACPSEAVKNNIFGTYNVVMAADKYAVNKFVLISTDKAVNPTNILGASKRFCEMLLQSMRETSNTRYVAVRFGNVLGSNGSVVPLFKKQINEGGPITVTDKRIIRYFMTISEAAQLVLQAGAMAEKSEVYVLDMGSPVKIIDLAEKLVRLSGYTPYEDIEIIETGLRPGEKLYEELLIADEELLTATSNRKIFIERQHDISQSEIKEQLKLLQTAVNTHSKAAIKTAMKKAVP
ncbi:MAG: nucleoside-diphosphate sugar epimerase/dehydratase, partial [Oscillospiraceae bacterium]